MTARLTEIRARLAKVGATPAPWLAMQDYGVAAARGEIVADARNSFVAALIAAAPADLEWACAEIERLKASLASRIELHDADGRNLLNAHREIERLDGAVRALKEKLDDETTWKLQHKAEIERLTRERDAAFRAGADAMREELAVAAWEEARRSKEPRTYGVLTDEQIRQHPIPEPKR